MGRQTSAAIARRKTASVTRDPHGRVIAHLKRGGVVATLAGDVSIDAEGKTRADVRVCGAVVRRQRVSAYTATAGKALCERQGNQQEGRKAEGKGARHGEG